MNKPRSRAGQYLTTFLLVSAVPRALLAADPPAGSAAPKAASAPAAAAPKAASAPAAAPPAAPAAAAAAAPTAADAAEGKRHFDVGLKLFKEQVFDAALLEFQQSYKLGRRPTALRNIAQCHRELKQFVEAYEAFDKLLTDHAAQLKEPEKKDVQRAMADLALVTATLDVKVNEAAAEILIDGKKVADSPVAKKLRVAVGTHKVRAQKLGFDPAETEILLVGQQEGSVELSMKPEVKAGHLVVREQNNKAVRVFVDDKDVGPAPWEGDLPPGVHTVEAKGANLASPKQTVEIANKAKAELVLDAASTAAHFKVAAQPSSAVITLDGQKVATGVWEADVPEGDHKLEVTAPGYLPYSRQMKAVAGQTQAQDVTLVADAPVAEAQKEPDYSGIYGNLSLMGQFGLAGSGGLYDPCNTNQVCSKSPPVGGGLGLRLGYNIEFIGIEVAGLFMGEYRSETMQASGPQASNNSTIDITSGARRTEDLYLGGYHGFVGLGPRVTSKGQSIRFTLGITPGFSLRNYVMGRTANIDLPLLTPTVYTDNASGSAFGMLMDGGILIGGTPGTKLSLGVIAWIDFADNVRTVGGAPVTSTVSGSPVQVSVTRPQYPVTNAANIYIGPSIGLHFGH